VEARLLSLFFFRAFFGLQSLWECGITSACASARFHPQPTLWVVFVAAAAAAAAHAFFSTKQVFPDFANSLYMQRPA